MKRSEMLYKISDIIHTHRRATQGVPSTVLAEMVLDYIEEAGMLPPYVKKNFIDRSTADYAYMSEWEDED